LEQLIDDVSGNDRVCPIAKHWARLWELLGKPDALKPLILNGAWASDRAKQQRFHDHLKLAAELGKFDEAATFVRALQKYDWEYLSPRGWDWSYGDHLAQESRRRDESLLLAKCEIEKLRLNSESSAFSVANLARTLQLFHIIYGDTQKYAPWRDQMFQAVTTYNSLTKDEDFNLLDGEAEDVVSELDRQASSMEVKAHILNILIAFQSAVGGTTLDAAEIEDLLSEIE
jgi:hypothetical protein